MSIGDINLIPTRVVNGTDTLTRNDFVVVLNCNEEVGDEFDLTLPAGKNDLVFKFGFTQAAVDSESSWVLIPDGDDIVDAAIGVLGAATKSIVFKNGTWYLIA